MKELKPKLLMTPGPTIVPERILKALSMPIIHHRTPEFTEILRDAAGRLKPIFKTDNDAFILYSSGTGAMEAAIANTINPGDKVVSIVSGKFSERLRDIAIAYGANVESVEFNWGSEIDVEKIKEKITEDTKAVTIVQNETSTGVRNPVWKIGEITKETDTLLITDVISSIAGDNIQTDKWGVDLCIGGSQKCFALPPGLAFITVSEKAWNAIEKNENRKFYFDLMKYKKKFPQTPFTSSISLLYALEESLDMIEEEGLENRIKRHVDNAEFCRTEVKKLGLELFPEKEEIASVTLTAIKHEKSEEIRTKLKENYDILVAGGQSHVKGKIFRIGHMGFVGRSELEKTISALEEVLGDL